MKQHERVQLQMPKNEEGNLLIRQLQSTDTKLIYWRSHMGEKKVVGEIDHRLMRQEGIAILGPYSCQK